MYNVNDILARLQNGESADSIAQSFADALNGAIQKQEEEKAAANKRAEKIADMTTVVNGLLSYGKKYYPELAGEANFEVAAEDIETMVDEIDKAMTEANKLAALLNPTAKAAKSNEPATFTIKGNSDPLTKFFTKEDPIAKFLRDNGLV